MQDVFEKIIEKLEDLEVHFDNDYFSSNREAMVIKKDAIEIVKQEAENYNNGWIPCSERLPNQDGEFADVLITCESIADGVFVQSAEFYVASDGEPVFDSLYHYERVLAWKPLPESYKLKGE